MNDEESKKTNVINGLLERIKANKKIQYLIIFIMFVLALFIYLFGFKVENSANTKNEDEVLLYVNNLENKLSDVLSKVSGAGKVDVIITIESGRESVLAMKTTTKEGINGIETETSPIIVNGKTVVVKELYPKIIGVLIVAKGAKNISVMQNLQQATISLLDIDINQIEILTMN